MAAESPAFSRRYAGVAAMGAGILLLAAGAWLRFSGALALGDAWRSGLSLAGMGGGLLLGWQGARWLFRRNVFGPFLGLLMVYLVFVAYAPVETFVTLQNTKTILVHSVIVGIAALGMTLVIVSGGIDLSVGSMVALTMVVAALTLRLGGEFETTTWAVWLAVAAAVAAGAFCGFCNGFLASAFGLMPFIVTLGTMQVLRGVAKYLAGEQTVMAPRSALNELMVISPAPFWFWGVWVFVLLTVGLAAVLRYTVFGRYVYALGSNEETARLCGIPVTRYRVLIYSLNGAFVGLAGLMQFGFQAQGDPTAAIGMELEVIAAVVIGGGSLSGGEGTAVGSLVGALLMAVLANGCNQVGIPNYVQEIVVGAAIIGAVAIDRLKHRGTT